MTTTGNEIFPEEARKEFHLGIIKGGGGKTFEGKTGNKRIRGGKNLEAK